MSGDELKQLLGMMQEMTAAIKTLIQSQEKLATEQQKQAKAIGEIGVLLTTHGCFIQELCARVGVESVEGPASPPQPN